MSPRRLAVVDQGSTSTKGALSTPEGRLSHETAEATPTDVVDGRVVLDPRRAAEGVRRVLDRLLAAAEVDAIGLTCQRSTCLLWERKSGEPLTTAFSWQDVGEAHRLEALREEAEEVERRTGLRLSPHYAASKLAALLEEIPRGRERGEAGEIVAGTLDTFLMRTLVGRDVTEPGHAGRTLLHNLEKNRWDSELCRIFGVPRRALAEIGPSAGHLGSYRGVPVTALAGDQQAALLGHGGWAEGVVAAHFGTGAFVLAPTGRAPRRHRGLLAAALAAGPGGVRYQLEGSVNSAGRAVDTVAGLLGLSVPDFPDRPLDPEDLPWVLPAFAGLAAPWWRPDARAVVARLGPDPTPADLVRGTLCGVAMRVLDCVEALVEAGIAVEVLRASGKLCRLEGLVGLLADAGQLPVEVSEVEETGLAGIARLAATGDSGDESPLGAPVRTRFRREPAWPADRAEALRTDWRRFVSATPGLDG